LGHSSEAVPHSTPPNLNPKSGPRKVALGRPQPAAQSEVLPLGNVDAHHSLSTGAAEVFPGNRKQKLEKAKDKLCKPYRNKKS
jgi:hypothetical protein